ncbi:PA2169 family four-helix-bundle protein [Ningiella sp. W23]|uniref:PA2169 family four-helix-bundle protein n=1 Tax=Ningiella sp. W23 TaxID=3023715 RepID=UPI003757C264
MSNQVKKVADVIKVLQGGIEFYQEAIKKVDTQSFIGIFQRMISEKQEAINSLQPFAINEQGEKEDDTHWMIDSRKMYTSLISKMSSDAEHTYIDQLEEVEDKVLESLDDALSEEQPEGCLSALRQVRIKAQKMHDEMKDLQEATE